MTNRLVEGVTHVQVPVRDVTQATDWYCKYLNCEVIQVHPTNAILRFGTGPTIFLWQTSDLTAATFTVNGEPFPAIGIETKDMDSLVSLLASAGVEIHQLPGDIPGRRFMKFFDPDGNMFVVHQEPS